MRKIRLCLLLSLLMLSMGAGSVFASDTDISDGYYDEADEEDYDAFNEDDELEEDEEEHILVKFNANGGTGSMADLDLIADETKGNLPACTFKRSGFTFLRWNTDKKCDGYDISDQLDYKKFCNKVYRTEQVTLYAQWKPNKPSVKKVSVYGKQNLKVTFAKNSKVSGFEIECSANKNFAKSYSVDVKSSASSVIVPIMSYGKKNYVRIRSYIKTGYNRTYSDWSKVKTSKKAPAGISAFSVNADIAVEADVKLNGSGTGFHAKLVVQTATSAISFGIQCHTYQPGDNTDRAYPLVENIRSNAPGEQEYFVPGKMRMNVGKTYHLMITYNTNGKGEVYVDNTCIGSYYNPNLKGALPVVSLEGSARKNGDTVCAEFSNIHVKINNRFTVETGKTGRSIQTCPTIKVKSDKKGKITVTGKITGLRDDGDWDSQFDIVSGIRRYY